MSAWGIFFRRDGNLIVKFDGNGNENKWRWEWEWELLHGDGRELELQTHPCKPLVGNTIMVHFKTVICIEVMHYNANVT